MRGFATKKGSAWYAVIEMPRDPDTGKRHRKWHSGYRTRKDAEAALVDLMSRMQQGTYVEPSRKTLDEFLEEWLTTIRSTVRESTWSSYRAEIRKHVLPRLGAVRLQTIGAPELNSLYSHLLASGRRDGKGGLSPRTVRYIHTILHGALETAVRWNLIPRNPASMAEPPAISRGRREMNTWTPEQVQSFLKVTTDDRLHGAWLLLATTGMRRGEVLGLRWSDIDLDRRRVAIDRSLISVNYGLRLEDPKTPRSRRSIAIDQETAARLRAHRRVWLEERLALGAGDDPKAPMFCGLDGTPIHPDRFSKLFKRIVSETGLPRIRLHDLRHTHATLALQAGIHPKVVADRLGHSSVSLTLDTYSHAVPALDEAAAEILGQITHGQIP